MPKKKGFTPERYQKKVLSLLSKYHVITTTEVCEKMEMGHETALKYLGILLKNNKIKCRERRKQKFWYI